MTTTEEEESSVPLKATVDRAFKAGGDVTGSLRRRKQVRFPSSLDFERVVNEYSIQATKDRLLELDDGEEEKIPSFRSNSFRSNASTRYDTFKDESDDYLVVPPPPPPPPPPPRRAWHRRTKPTPLGYTGRTATRWALTNLTGLMTGLMSIFLVSATESIQAWRSSFVDAYWRQADRMGHIFIAYASVNLALALVSAALCLFLAPAATGSGIPEVKSYLNGVRVRRFSSARLFFVKVVATILSVSSGLAIGPEGPLVHLGAILGASCTKVSNLLLQVLPHSSSTNRLWTFLSMDLAHFATDAERRDLVSMGAAAGFAAAFGAPIGGLLFAMEEASSYVENTMFLKTLVATSIATFCLAVHRGDLSRYSIIEIAGLETSDESIFLNRVEEIPLYILMGAAGGILGGVFCLVWKSIQLKRQTLYPDGKYQAYWKLFEVACVSLSTSSLIYYLPMFHWSCRLVVTPNDDLAEHNKILKRWQFHAHQFDCQPGEINEMAAIFFGSREEAISDILTDPTQFSPHTLWTTGVLFYVLMVLTLGVALPSGIFMPTFLSGSSLGGAAGMVFQRWVSRELSPSTFALLGAAALLAGIQRSSVSIVVILVEGTGQVKIIIPVIITVVVARYVGDRISQHGLYETSIFDVNNYPYLEREEQKMYDICTVQNIMSSPVITFGPRERVQTLVKVLRETSHNGFPVVDPDTKEFLGLVRRDQLVALLEFGVFDAESSTNISAASSVSGPGTPTKDAWTPQPGIGRSPLMHLAYHIKDDRYEHVDDTKVTHPHPEQDDDDDDDDDDEDEGDVRAWINTVRQTCEHWDEQGIADSAAAMIVSDDMPVRTLAEGEFALLPTTVSSSSPNSSTPQQMKPIIGTNQRGNLFIAWIDPAYKRHWVRVSAVMNRGTYTVSQHCPVSKAHYMFTALGLRHLIVLGGGGRVVGLLTRINLLKDSIKERTGIAF